MTIGTSVGTRLLHCILQDCIKKNEETKSSPLRFTLLVQVQLDPNIPHIDTLYATCVV